MHFVTLDSETDFEGWRKAARTLVLNRVNPFDVTWTLQRHEPELFDQSAAPGQPLEAPHGTFTVSAKFIELAQSAVLHRDPGRFALLYRLLWRLRRNHDHASMFSPARLQPEKPKKYWRNLPGPSMIKPLMAGAGRATGAVMVNASTEPHKSEKRPEPSMRHQNAAVVEDLDTLREEAAHCRACDLWKNATQTVFGEGPQHAQAVLVGEQPGDKEDLVGKPFVGPAGQMLDRALEEAGINRKKVYVTNAVKHFKFVKRGKTRLHQKPNTSEIKACRQWYERELALIRPVVVVAMGTTAAQCLFGKVTPINKNRGRLIDLDEGIKALVTVHPSYLLRLPDADARAREYQRFVDDLKVAAAVIRKSARAA